MAISADDRDGAVEMKEDEGLDFPVLYGVDVDDIRERMGLYIQKNDVEHLQPAQFVLDPEGKVRYASYSSGKVGRLDAEEALEVVEEARG